MTANPAKPGTATLSMTGQSFSGCTVSTSGITVKSVAAYKLPFKTTVSDAKGLPVTVTKPGAVVTVSALGTTITCTYQAPKISGTASNTGSSVAFANQTFTLVSGGSLCPSSGTLSVTYAPLADTSVKGDPHVFVN